MHLFFFLALSQLLFVHKALVPSTSELLEKAQNVLKPHKKREQQQQLEHTY